MKIKYSILYNKKKIFIFWKRFGDLHNSCFLHFTNNEVVDKADDHLYKLWYIIDYLNEQYLRVFATEYISLNKSLMKYTDYMLYK